MGMLWALTTFTKQGGNLMHDDQGTVIDTVHT